nr:metallophosphoesterase [Bacillota bacterium]
MAVTRLKYLHILHTNDLHSHFERMPKIATLLSQLQRENRGDEAWIAVDVGDHMDRGRMETEGTGGMANRAVLEATGYQVVTLGNNELLTFPREALDRVYAGVSFSVVGTNIEPIRGSRPEWLKKWAVREVGGLRIGFLGATIPYPIFYEQMGWRLSDPLEVLAEWVPKIRGKVDVLVLLSHLGLSLDRRLAEEVPGIDLILGGHTHHLLEVPERVGNTFIAAAGKYGQHVGHVTLEWDAERGCIAGGSGRVRPVEGIGDSEEILRRIEQHRREGKKFLSSPIGCLDRPLSIDWYRESPLGNLLADGLREWVGAEVALVNAGQLLGGLDRGPVTKGRLHQICPHPINPCKMMLTGRQILRTLEEALLEEFQHLKIRGFGFRGERLGTINVSGLQVEYRPEAKPYQKIRSVRVGGERLQEDRKYQVASVDMFTFGVGYFELQNGEDVRYYLPEFLRDVLAWRLQRPESVKDCLVPRWIRV